MHSEYKASPYPLPLRNSKALEATAGKRFEKKNNVVPIIIISHKQDTPIGAATSEVVVFVVTYSMQYSDTTLAGC